MAKTILMFQVNNEKQAVLRRLSARQKFSVKQVPVSSYTKSLGSLAGEKVEAEAKRTGVQPVPQKFPMEMILFCGFSSEDLDQFLAEYRQSGVPTIPLKAVLTQHNRSWTPVQLFRELFLEHLKLSGS